MDIKDYLQRLSHTEKQKTEKQANNTSVDLCEYNPKTLQVLLYKDS